MHKYNVHPGLCSSLDKAVLIGVATSHQIAFVTSQCSSHPPLGTVNTLFVRPPLKKLLHLCCFMIRVFLLLGWLLFRAEEFKQPLGLLLEVSFSQVCCFLELNEPNLHCTLLIYRYQLLTFCHLSYQFQRVPPHRGLQLDQTDKGYVALPPWRRLKNLDNHPRSLLQEIQSLEPDHY